MFLSARRRKVVVGIASPSHAVEVEIVEQQALVIDRLHRKRLVKDSRAGLQIHQCVVHIAASGHVVGAVAEFDGRSESGNRRGLCHRVRRAGLAPARGAGLAVGVWAKSVSGDHTIIAVAHRSTARAIAIRRLL